MIDRALKILNSPREKAGLHDIIEEILSTDLSTSDRAQASFKFLVDLTDADGAVLIRIASDEEPVVVRRQSSDFIQVPAIAMEQAAIAAKTNAVQITCGQSPSDPMAQRFLAVPLGSEQARYRWIAVVMMVASADQFLIALTRERAELVAGLARAGDRAKRTGVDVTAAGHSFKSLFFEPASRDDLLAKLCNHWENETKAEQIVFGIVDGPKVTKLLSGESGKKLESTTHGASLIDAMEKAIDRVVGDECGNLPAEAGGPEFDCLVDNVSDRSTVICPLRWDGSAKAIILAEYHHSRAESGAARLQQELSANLEILAYRLRTDRTSSSLSMSKHLKKAGKAKLAAAGLVGVALLSFMPVDNQVRSPFVIAPQDKRIVVSPQEGVLRAVGVRPGDEVTFDQTILAELETTDVDLELTAVQARHSEAITTADLARAADIPGQAQAALLQAEAAQAQIDLLNYRRSLATIRAPRNGVVLKGETEKLVGSVVAQGQTLFEIGSVDAMKVELFVPDHEIDHVHEGGKGQLSPSAQPNNSMPFEVQRIYPMAEIREGQNVFRVVARLTAPAAKPSSLKPGMEGFAWVQAGRHPLASALFGELLDSLRMKLWF